MELRKHYFLNRWVLINPNRAKRPHQFKETKLHKKMKNCLFCPGNEKLTGKEIGRVGDPWRLRWFENKFPAVTEEGNSNIIKNKFYTHANAFGYHEVIVETPKHNKHIYDLNDNEFLELLKVYRNRHHELNSKKDIKFVSIFKNHGKNAGTSIEHSHSQVVAYGMIPEIIKEKISKSYKKKKCLYCDIVKKEIKSKRYCFSNKTFVAFCPYASRFHYEVWIIPKKHITNFDMNDLQLKDLNKIFQKILKKLKKLGCSFNYYFQNHDKLHFHIEIIPRIENYAGFEWSTETIINPITPEAAAKFYKEK